MQKQHYTALILRSRMRQLLQIVFIDRFAASSSVAMSEVFVVMPSFQLLLTYLKNYVNFKKKILIFKQAVYLS